jgi:hypothetical protein
MENTLIVGKQVEDFARLAAIKAMELWVKGIKSRRSSPKTIALRFGVKPGSAKYVLEQLKAK